MHILHHAKNAFIRQVLGGGADSVRVRARVWWHSGDCDRVC